MQNKEEVKGMGKSKGIGKLLTLTALAGSAAFLYKKFQDVQSLYHNVMIGKSELMDYDDYFEGDAVASLFSSLEIDLRNAQFPEDEVYLDLFGLCTAVEILIPEDVDVVFEGTNKASTFQLDQNENADKTRTLYLNYNLTASAIHVTDHEEPYDEEFEDFEEEDELVEVIPVEKYEEMQKESQQAYEEFEEASEIASEPADEETLEGEPSEEEGPEY